MAGKNGGRRKGLDPNRQLPKGLARALADRKTTADSEALLSDLIEVWGGTRQLALDVHNEFQKAPSGGMTRQRIVEMIQRLIVTNTTHEIGKSLKPSDMDDDELEAVALEYMKRVTDGPATTADQQQAAGTQDDDRKRPAPREPKRYVPPR
jgi:hypothetical protein